MLTKRNVLYTLIKARADSYVKGELHEDFKPFIEQQCELKRSLIKKREVDVLKCNMKGSIQSAHTDQEETRVLYKVHIQAFLKQNDFFYIEEEIEDRLALFYKDTLIQDELLVKDFSEDEVEMDVEEVEEDEERASYYDRLAAVQYAEKHWDKPNESYKQFEVNCTNYISQCLHAGKAPMRGYPKKTNGWWMRGNAWSYSWAVAHSMHSYLSNSKSGLRAVRKSSASELVPGDVICYDFEGDGRWNHTTIVVAKDGHGMPLVNANTYNSRMRYWAYEDSTAYTPKIKYDFFHIVDR
ncbi:hypothetical protein C2I27_16515 [Priestia megaterium]|uniref:amidase domain-containing protein n=1 Tax=Priestia TaxID=2800373 RepID=UPI000D50AB73|nr:amidase domain-containing protein [Priestia megaterium]MBU8855617.1 amidase domain-containing protein [Bacillus sp. FJAT-26377]PVC67410.1 hypothetical protein C2I27_16515 [Priestia megaterium]